MKKVIVGMSGGVDSSVAAALLTQQGYNVTGIFMKNWSDHFAVKGDCPWEQDFRDAQAAAHTIGIPLHTMNFEKEYKERVVDYFFREYQTGRTPNPDIVCNSEIKFKLFFDKAVRLGADLVATGHYARVKKSLFSQARLLKGVDGNKDQSYFLYAINSAVLKRVIFPVGSLKKPKVREIAHKLNLPNRDKKDSQGICFIGEVDLRKFLSQYIDERPGDIIDWDSGEVVGKHEGLAWYTIGQRKGMHVGGTGLPLYVAGKDMAKNELYVVKGNYNPRLYQSELIAKNLTWLSGKPKLPREYTAKIRYRQTDQDCLVEQLDEDRIKVIFKEQQRAVTPGQSVVLYKKDVCLGGGIIQ